MEFVFNVWFRSNPRALFPDYDEKHTKNLLFVTGFLISVNCIIQGGVKIRKCQTTIPNGSMLDLLNPHDASRQQKNIYICSYLCLCVSLSFCVTPPGETKNDRDLRFFCKHTLSRLVNTPDQTLWIRAR